MRATRTTAATSSPRTASASSPRSACTSSSSGGARASTGRVTPSSSACSRRGSASGSGSTVPSAASHFSLNCSSPTSPTGSRSTTTTRHPSCLARPAQPSRCSTPLTLTTTLSTGTRWQRATGSSRRPTTPSIPSPRPNTPTPKAGLSPAGSGSLDQDSECDVSYSTTRTATFTITSARYLTSKIAADLRSMSRLYGEPDLVDIDDYAAEAALLLRDGYLDRVDYGLRRRDAYGAWEWALRLRYVATTSNTLQDMNPGGVPANANTTGASWYSYLAKSAAFSRLTPQEQAAVEATLPIRRTGAPETGTGAGVWTGERAYSRDGTTLTRTVFVA